MPSAGAGLPVTVIVASRIGGVQPFGKTTNTLRAPAEMYPSQTRARADVRLEAPRQRCRPIGADGLHRVGEQPREADHEEHHDHEERNHHHRHAPDRPLAARHRLFGGSRRARPARGRSANCPSHWYGTQVRHAAADCLRHRLRTRRRICGGADRGCLAASTRPRSVSRERTASLLATCSRARTTSRRSRGPSAAGAVFCAVVDPGVGTERRAIAIEAGNIRCVAPDNGLISYLWGEAAPGNRRAASLEIGPEAAPTFHGRDVFAPCSAALASTQGLEAAGTPIDDPAVLASAFAQRLGNHVTGRVVVVDHFGNAITTIRLADIDGAQVRAVTWPGGGVGRPGCHLRLHQQRPQSIDRQRRPRGGRCPGNGRCCCRWPASGRRRRRGAGLSTNPESPALGDLTSEQVARLDAAAADCGVSNSATHGDRRMAGCSLRVGPTSAVPPA